MNPNVGTFDRVVRIVAGLLLIGLAFSGTLGLWAYIGIVPLVTGLFGFCPAYKLFGFSSCPMNQR